MILMIDERVIPYVSKINLFDGRADVGDRARNPT